MEDVRNKEGVLRAQKAISLFDKNIKIQILNKTAKTAKEAALALDCEVGAIVKSLLLRADEGFIICLIPGDKKCSLNKLKKLTNKKDVCMANADQVKDQTGYTIGGVSPVGHIKKNKIMIDLKLKRFGFLYAAAGHPNCIFKISYKKLIEISNGKEVDISE